MPILGLFLLALWIFCIVDVIISDESDVRNLPRLAWLLVVLLVPDIGSMVWLILGRPLKTKEAADPPPSPSSPGEDADFLRRVRRRAEEQRRAAREHPAAEDET